MYETLLASLHRSAKHVKPNSVLKDLIPFLS